MESQFTVEEKRKWLLKKHLKDHCFAYILDVVLTMVFAFLLLSLCKAESIMLGMVISFVWAMGRVIWQIYYYKKEYVDINVK